MAFEPVYTVVFQASLSKLDGFVKEVVAKRIKKILENPFLGKPLQGEHLYYSERFMHYRLIYYVQGNSVIFLRVGKRDSVYREY